MGRCITVHLSKNLQVRIIAVAVAAIIIARVGMKRMKIVMVKLLVHCTSMAIVNEETLIVYYSWLLD